MYRKILLKSIFAFLTLFVINIVHVNAEKAGDCVKCYYSIPVKPYNGYGATAETKNFEFIVKIGTTSSASADCKMYFYDDGVYNDDIPYDPMEDENGNSIPGCYNWNNIYTCGYYNCWASNNGYEAYNQKMNWMYDMRNGRYVYFHYGKEFYEQYYREGGKCPELWGEIGQDEILYLRLNQQLASDFGPIRARVKTVITDGVVKKMAPNQTHTATETKNCEYQFQASIKTNSVVRYKMSITKTYVQATGLATYTVKLTESASCDPIELKAIESMNNGKWQEYLGSSSTQYQLYIPEATLKELIGSDCESSNHLVTNYSKNVITLSIDKSANSTMSMTGFCENENGKTPSTASYKDKVNYSNLCTGEEGIRSAFKILGTIIYVLKIVAPLLIIVTGIIDYFKAMTSSDEEALSKATQTLARRIISGILVFFIPTILWAILSLLDITDGIHDLNNSEFGVCTKCLLKNECTGNTDSGGTPDRTSGSSSIKQQMVQ